MSDSLEDRVLAEARWQRRSRRRHPVLAAVLGILVAAAAAPLLLRAVHPTPVGPPAGPTEVAAISPAVASTAADSVVPGRVSADAAEADSAPRVSPFRRAHPWAAPLDGKYYYPSSCPAVLAMKDLVFYRSERAARAAGRRRGSQPGC